MQRSEDPARHLRSVWLGPTGAWRWPFDATYTEWAIGLVAHLFLMAVLWFVLPFGVLMIGGSMLAAGWTSRRMDRRTLARWTFTEPDRARRRAYRVLLGVNVALVLLLFPNPMTWILPLPLLAAGCCALVSAILLVRAARPWIDGNRPVSYWVSAFWSIARGPRPRRDPVVFGFTGGPQVPDQLLDDDLMEFLAAVAAVTEEEIQVRFFKRRVPTVEAMHFCQGQHEHVVRWLRGKGLPVRVLDVTRREVRGTNGGLYVIPLSARIQIGELPPVEDDQWVVLSSNRADPVIMIDVIDPGDFERDFEEVG